MHGPSDTAALAPGQAVGNSLWNPVIAACWSVVFTPAFGTWLVMRNWEVLGQPREAARARVWFRISLGLLALQLLANALDARLNSQSNLMHWLGIGFLVLWCLAEALPQAWLVRARHGAAYPHKRWDEALLAAASAGTLYFAAGGCLNFLFVALT